MAISLYDLSVANYLQTLTGLTGVLTKGATYFESAGVDADQFLATRLHDDMLPFQFQIASVAHHSLGAINGIKAGVFRPPGQLSPATYADMQKTLADTITALQAITPAEVNALEGKDVSFELGAFKMPFVAENFILSFSLPNFYFHATTTYDILRTHGVTLGKRDFMGPLRLKA